MQENCKDSQRNIQGDAGCVRELQGLAKILQGDAGCARGYRV